MLLDLLTLMCFCMVIRTDEGSVAPYPLHLSTSSGKLSAGLVTIHSSASLLSRICGPVVQNDLLVSEGHKPGGVACCVGSIYSVGSSTLHLPQELFACPFPNGGWLAWLLLSTTLQS